MQKKLLTMTKCNFVKGEFAQHYISATIRKNAYLIVVEIVNAIKCYNNFDNFEFNFQS